MFGFGKSKHKNIGVLQLAGLLDKDQALVVDVREVDEFAAGHVPGAINMPLSTFQPSKLPQAGDKTIVLMCLAGGRSSIALEKCSVAQQAIDTHLEGGFKAWTSAGLPVEH